LQLIKSSDRITTKVKGLNVFIIRGLINYYILYCSEVF